MNPAKVVVFCKQVSIKESEKIILQELLSSSSFPEYLLSRIKVILSKELSPLRFTSADPKTGCARLDPSYDAIEVNNNFK